MLTKKTDLYIGVAVCLLPILYCIFLFLLGPKSIIQVADNLDSEVSFRVVIKNAGLLFSTSNDNVTTAMLGTIPRNAYNVPAFHMTTFLFGVFNPLHAYLLNFSFVMIIGLFGMLWFCLRFIFCAGIPWRITLSGLAAVAFILQPLYAIYGIAVIGLPWLIMAWDAMRKTTSLKIWMGGIAFAAFYTFYSSLVLGGYAVIMVSSGCFVWMLARNRKRDALALGVLLASVGVSYLVSEQDLIRLFIYNNGFISHRTEYNLIPEAIALQQVPAAFWESFVTGYFDAPFPAHVALLMACISIPVLAFSRTWNHKRLVLGILSGCVAISVFDVCYWSLAFSGIRASVPLLNQFQFDRFTCMFPLLWIILEALLVRDLLDGKRWMRIVAAGFLLLQLTYTVYHNPYYVNTMIQAVKAPLGHPLHHTWGEFFAESLFQNIDREYPHIRRDGKVACIGFYPAIPEYNGFSTVDGYHNNYPLEYKHRFRKVIEGELAVSSKYQPYFDDWGNRCYLFSHELNDDFSTLDGSSLLKDVRFNFQAVHELGGTHVFSSLEIVDADSHGLRLLQRFHNSESPLTLFVYEIKEIKEIKV
jgi:hypothetical protein